MTRLRKVGIGLLIGSVGSFGLLSSIVAWQVSVTPGGAEEWVGDKVSWVRAAFPSLTGPIEQLELVEQRWAYDANVWWSGGKPESEQMHALPESVIVDVPAIEGEEPEPTPVAVAAPVEAPRAPVEGGVVPLKNPPAAGPIPGLGPHEVPEVPFDPAILDVPLEWTTYPEAPDWVRAAWPVLNDAFPDDHALVLEFDMQRAGIRWQPGTGNPWPTNKDKEKLADASPAPDRSGRVPKAIRDRPFVAFGGGWESIHFASYGGVWDGRSVVRMSKGVQTMAIYADGHTDLGPWPLSEDGLVEARQNLPPLVHLGKIPSNIVYLNMGSLGTRHKKDDEGKYTFTDVHTWRSALGRRANGDLVYMFADRVTPLQLAATLIRAGAVEAMQLDINAAYHAVPTLFLPKGSKTAAQGMFPGIRNGGTRFLNGSPKDFFYVTDREVAVAPLEPAVPTPATPAQTPAAILPITP